MMDMQPGGLKELGVVEAADITILDVLNEDCWRLILDHVPVKDIVRSERVSRAWQRLVLDYLAGVHNYHIEYIYDLYSELPEKYWNYRSINLQGHVTLFEEMIQKMGPFIVRMVANCIDENRLRAIALHCTNLEAITFFRTFRNLPLAPVAKCRRLKRVVFDSCAFREDYLRELTNSDSLEELIINKGRHVTGRFLTNLRQYLKTLALNNCDFILFRNLEAARSYLTELTRLELNKNFTEVLENVHTLLDKMPKLEHLSLMSYDVMSGPRGELPAVIGRLSRLKELRLWSNLNVTDEWLAAVAVGCPALRVVDVGRTSASGRGVLALCRARPALAHLGLGGLDVSDAELAACARSCADLQLLDAMACIKLTRGLLKQLARPRPRPLVLLHRFHPQNIAETEHYQGLILRWRKTSINYHTSRYVDSDDSNSDSERSDHDVDKFGYSNDIVEQMFGL